MPPQPQQPSVLALTPETGASPCLDSDGATDTVRLVLPLPDGVVAGAPVADHQPAGKKRKKGKAAKESSSFEFHLDGDGEHGDPEPFLQALEEQQHLLQVSQLVQDGVFDGETYKLTVFILGTRNPPAPCCSPSLCAWSIERLYCSHTLCVCMCLCCGWHRDTFWRRNVALQSLSKQEMRPLNDYESCPAINVSKKTTRSSRYIDH